ncbi:conjugative transposon protein TraN [Chitinophaga polysaccharea]|uniref:conjugative transposon protein TraN n=1 Tax=Chitinophaga polysaccharea TaxID=1293035 RepID=UPI001158D41B|nr:conjugative transposon protein TraN [Chitinophaga polysaccharea]
MKLVFSLLFAVCSMVAFGQNKVKAFDIAGAYPLEITTHKTTLLIFPAPIEDGDRGDRSVSAERVAKVSNLLKVKALDSAMQASTLHVVTTDGKIYSFSVSYSPQPAQHTIDVSKLPYKTKASFKGVSLNEREIEDYAATVLGSPAFMTGVKVKANGLKLKLEAIFIKDDVLFFRYNLTNDTRIGYNAYQPKFYIRDKARAKRTAIQNTEIDPIYIQYKGKPEETAGQSIIVAFSKFTIAENKNLIISLHEADGDRNLECGLSQKKLLKAKAFSY